MKYQSNLVYGLACLVTILFVTQSATGQRRSSYRANAKNHSDIKKIYSELTEPLGKSTLRINSDNANIALGTVVDASGLIVTKASEIADREITCVIDGKEFEPEILATDDTTDLALLKVDLKDLVPVKFAVQDAIVESGQFVVSVDYDAEPESIGVVTVKPRLFRTGRRRTGNRPRQGYLGVQTDSNPSGDGVIIVSVSPKTAASRAGLRARDVVLQIGEDEVNSREQLSRAIKKFKPGEQVAIKVLRGDDDKPRELTAKLGDFAEVANSGFDQWGGGPFSKRRFNFPKVIAHDSVLKPNKMGGPLLNSDGKVIGINIARALRVSTYAIPAQTVLDFVKKNREALPTGNDR